MKKNKPKYLNLYYQWMKSKQMDSDCLCNFFLLKDCTPNPNYPEFKIISPTQKECNALQKEGLNFIYWGSGEYEALRWEFTPIRQTLVLLMAAMNNEL